MASFQCHACGAPVPFDEPIPRESSCEGCGADLRACRNCRHHDPRYNNSCRETMADLVEDHARRNFCEYFSFSREPFVASAGQSARAAEARAKLGELFGKKPDGRAEDEDEK